MDPIPPVWKEQRHVQSLAVDVRGRLRPQTLFAYLLDAAASHAHGTAFGYEELSARNLMWVTFKMQVIVRRQPRWGDRITIETWGKRIERLYALRDFVVTAASGEKMVLATSAWLILDQGSGRPQRFAERANSFPWLPARNEMETDLARVPELENGKQVGRYRVHFSDIDVNRHVNATRYLQWIVDSHSEEHLEASEAAAFELSFLAEAKPGDEVAVFAEEVDGRELCAVRRAGDGKELCRARLQWRRS